MGTTANETFYYGFSEKKTIDIQVNVKLDHEVDMAALDKAVENMVFPRTFKDTRAIGLSVFLCGVNSYNVIKYIRKLKLN